MGILITEDNNMVNGVIVESRSDGEKKYFVEGIFIQAEIKNRNGRKYARRMIEEEVNRYRDEKIATKMSIGELGHPPTPVLSHERASHLIESLEQDPSNPNNFIGRARVLTKLPMGSIVKGLIDEGITFGTSTRGVGGLKKLSNGVTEVHNFRLSTAGDIVTENSAPDAILNSIVENVSWVYDEKLGWKAQTLAEDIKNEVKTNYKTITEARKIQLFEQFLGSIAR